MRQITLTELQDILRECAGEDESAQPLEQTADQPFDQLGYDSLALLETHSRIECDFGIDLPEDEVGAIKTPASLVHYVNTRLAAS
jgi:minimal PKS acyl carrier protein